MITFHSTSDPGDLQDILHLQAKNVEAVLTDTERSSEGYVTVRHDLPLLTAMASYHPQIACKDGSSLVGYALVMDRTFRHHIPVLIPMFDQIDGLSHDGMALKDAPYVIMGQICIDKAYRKRRLFHGLYEHLFKTMAGAFDMVITEVSERNPRSYHAHLKAGFDHIHTYESGEKWHLMLRTRTDS